MSLPLKDFSGIICWTMLSVFFLELLVVSTV